MALVVGGLGFEFCVFVAGWRHALRSEWPFIIIINGTRICLPSILLTAVPSTLSCSTPGLLMDIPSVKTGQQLYMNHGMAYNIIKRSKHPMKNP